MNEQQQKKKDGRKKIWNKRENKKNRPPKERTKTKKETLNLAKITQLQIIKSKGNHKKTLSTKRKET